MLPGDERNLGQRTRLLVVPRAVLLAGRLARGREHRERHARGGQLALGLLEGDLVRADLREVRHAHEEPAALGPAGLHDDAGLTRALGHEREAVLDRRRERAEGDALLGARVRGGRDGRHARGVLHHLQVLGPEVRVGDLDGPLDVGDLLDHVARDLLDLVARRVERARVGERLLRGAEVDPVLDGRVRSLHVDHVGDRGRDRDGLGAGRLAVEDANRAAEQVVDVVGERGSGQGHVRVLLALTRGSWLGWPGHRESVPSRPGGPFAQLLRQIVRGIGLVSLREPGAVDDENGRAIGRVDGPFVRDLRHYLVASTSSPTDRVMDISRPLVPSAYSTKGAVKSNSIRGLVKSTLEPSVGSERTLMQRAFSISRRACAAAAVSVLSTMNERPSS